MGRALANSAASSSFASGVTSDFHVGKWSELFHTNFPGLRHLEDAEQRRQDLPWFGRSFDDLRPQNAGLERQHGAYDSDRAGDVDRARDDFVNVRLSRGSQHAVDGREKLSE